MLSSHDAFAEIFRTNWINKFDEYERSFEVLPICRAFKEL